MRSAGTKTKHNADGACVGSMASLCDACHKRHGSIVMDEVVGPFWTPTGTIEPFRFTYRLCRWCQAAETRRRKRAA
jgi:hypothetical protein